MTISRGLSGHPVAFHVQGHPVPTLGVDTGDYEFEPVANIARLDSLCLANESIQVKLFLPQIDIIFPESDRSLAKGGSRESDIASGS
jgi:hypothetical protein